MFLSFTFRAIMKPQAVEFLVHMALATVAAAVNSLAEEVMVDEVPKLRFDASVGEHDERYHPVSSHSFLPTLSGAILISLH